MHLTLQLELFLVKIKARGNNQSPMSQGNYLQLSKTIQYMKRNFWQSYMQSNFGAYIWKDKSSLLSLTTHHWNISNRRQHSLGDKHVGWKFYNQALLMSSTSQGNKMWSPMHFLGFLTSI